MPTIYQTYRPQKFEDFVGQEHIATTIKNEIALNKLAHAYLFSGPRGVGKTTVARLLAKSVNCPNRRDGDSEPCNECSSCLEINAGRNIDVIEIDAASNTGVDNVRENIIDNAQFQPTKSKYKVFIIDETHMLSTSASNALLKTLEEPPQYVIFILATTEPHKLLPTIISRCQRFGFKKIPFAIMLKRLEGICDKEEIKIEKKVLERIINKSDGCLRDAESLLGQIFSLNLKKISQEDAAMVLPSSAAKTAIEFLENIFDKNANSALDILNQMAEEGVNLDQFAHDLLEILRLLMILQTGQTKNLEIDYSDTDIKKIKKLAEEFDRETILKLLDAALARKREIKSSPLPQLPLEMMVVEFTGGSTVKPTTPTEEKEEEKDAEKNKEPDEKIEKHSGVVSEAIKNAVSAITRKTENKASFDDVKNKWPEIISRLSETSHSLIFILKMCDLQGVENGCLRINVPFAIHKEKLEEKKNKKIIEDKLAEIFNERIEIICDVAPVAEQTIENSNEEKDINGLAAEFGGEIVRE
ncbi:MAG: DNA polymerase III subunit gamma/tau [Candidatus Paceibacterota bacterium]|nr:DNA polymerase III subunit gamma/tau [Patescibacteria group bacterium]